MDQHHRNCKLCRLTHFWIAFGVYTLNVKKTHFLSESDTFSVLHRNVLPNSVFTCVNQLAPFSFYTMVDQLAPPYSLSHQIIFVKIYNPKSILLYKYIWKENIVVLYNMNEAFHRNYCKGAHADLFELLKFTQSIEKLFFANSDQTAW